MSSRRFRIGAAAVLTALGSGVACGSLEEGQIVIVDGDGQGGGGASSGGSASGTGNGSSGESSAGESGEGAAAGEGAGGSAGSNQGGASGGGTAGQGGTSAGAGGDGANGPGGEGGTPPIVDAPPTVVSVTPATDATGVSTDLASVTIEFSEPLAASSVTASSVRVLDGDVALAGALAVSGAAVTFTPAAPLQLLARYHVEVATSVTDAGGQALPEKFSSSFATADGAWGDKVDLDPDADAALLEISLASNARGDVLVGFVRPGASPQQTTSYVRWYRRAAGWEAPKPLNLAGTSSYRLALAVNDDGDAAVLFAERDATNVEGEKFYLQRLMTGTWQARKQLLAVGMNANVTSAQIELTPSGLAVFGMVISGTSINSGYSLPDGTTSNAGNGGSASVQAFAMDSNAAGRAMAVYRTFANGVPSVVRFARFNPDDNAWSASTGELPSSVGANPPDVAVSENGEAMAIWTRTPTNDVVASRFVPATGWSEPVALDTLTGACTITKHSIATDGQTFFAVWGQAATASLTNVYSSKFDQATKTWSAPALVSDGNSSVNTALLSLGMDRRGNALATWGQGQNTAYRGWYNRYSALNSAWIGPGNAPDSTNVFSSVSSTVAADGLAFGLWTKGVTSAFEFWAAPFE